MARGNTPVLWERVLGDLQQRLARGEFDERFPTDRELMDHYQVSRHTVRESVRRLQESGLITRTRGRGSYRTPLSFEQPLGTIYSLFRSVEDAGLKQTSVVLRQEMSSDDVATKVLDLPADAQLFHLERIRLAGEEPLALDSVWLPGPIGSCLLDANFTHTALYDELRVRCGVVPQRGTENISPVVLDRQAALHLGLSSGIPAFRIDRRTQWDDRPLEWRTTTVAGDRYAFRAEWDSPWEAAATQLIRRNDAGHGPG